MAGTYKTEIILELFKKRWDPETRNLRDPVVSTAEIREEHAAYRKRRDEPVEYTNSPAFFKDILRSTMSRNKIWPTEVFEAGFTARQVTGDGRCFEFMALAPGQTEPFPSVAPPPPAGMEPHRISSVSMPLASRRLGRPDEPWLVQVSVRLHLVETYFALFSSRKASVRQVDHLQNALKLRKTEIDALFLGIEESPSGLTTEFIITCEAKRAGEEIIAEQVMQQVAAVFKLINVTQAVAVPIALKSLPGSRVQIIEFAEVRREDATTLEALPIVNQALFELVPPVPGIGGKAAEAASQRNLVTDADVGDL